MLDPQTSIENIICIMFYKEKGECPYARPHIQYN